MCVAQLSLNSSEVRCTGRQCETAIPKKPVSTSEQQNKGKLSLDLKKKSSLEVIIMRLKVIIRYTVEY